MKREKRVSRSYTKGMVILIFFVLSVQAAIFIIKSYEKSEIVAQNIQSLQIVEREVVKTDTVYVVKGRDVVKGMGVKEVEVKSGYIPVDMKSVVEANRLELNRADSLDLISLPGIGPYYASKILSYRKRLGGFIFKEQLLEISGIDDERFGRFSKRVWVDSSLVSKVKITDVPLETLSNNPYLGSYVARSIIKFIEVEGVEGSSLLSLITNRVIREDLLIILKYYFE